MGISPTIDLDGLLAPISADQPCGVDPRRDTAARNLYFAVRTARATARDLERRADSDEEAGTPLPQWQNTANLAITLLREHAKDLEVTAWLIEALLRLHNCAGLRDGFLLAQGLIDRYWDGLFPLPDEDGMETRVAAFAGLNGTSAEGTLVQPIRKIPLTEPQGEGAFTYWHYDLATRPAVPEPARRGKGPRRVTLDDIKAAMKQSSATFIRSLGNDLQTTRSTFQSVTQALGERCGSAAPPSSYITGVLDDVQGAFRHLTQELGLAMTVEPESPIAAPVIADPGEPPTPTKPGGPIRSREDAFRLLTEVAEYFRHNEPHSPLSYAIEDLIRRGRMSLPELLVELLPDRNTRNVFLTTAGIWPPKE